LRVATKILAYLDLIFTHLFKEKHAKARGAQDGVAHWVPPPVGWVSINVDAALFPSESRMGWGVVARDHTGAFILSCSEGSEVMPMPEVAEALAVRRALSIAKDHDFVKIVLYSDCLSLIQRISSRSRDRSEIGAMITNINSMASDLESCSFKFSGRKYNVVAHKLARSAEPLVCKLSIGVIPEYIRAELCNDVS
jgi:ribonuclease HI